jgi:phospholipase C
MKWLVLAVVLSACASGDIASGPADAAAPTPDAAPPTPDAAPAPEPDAGPTCPSPAAADDHLAERLACAFGPGALAADTVGLDEAARARLPIRHIIVMMKENRSFDHLLGGLPALQPDAEVFPAGFTNPDLQGSPVAPFHLGTTCLGQDPDHQWDAMHAQIDDGAMDGYVTSAARTTGGDGHFAIGYYQPADLPFDYFLASTYALADHYFPSVRSGTFPNRDYLLLATSDGVTATQYSIWPDPTLPSIFDRLDDAGVSWGVYGDDHPLEETLNDPAHFWEGLHPWHPVQDLVDALATGDLPAVIFVDGIEDYEDDHPTADLQLGEAWVKRIYDAAVAGPAWDSTVILYTYDEAGGFFDHLPPPEACLARPEDAAFHELGTRVPLIVISPWARRHHVSHSLKEHTSITRFIEAVHGLPALTARDANSDALLDMFDFDCAPAPVPEAPAAGTGGCKGPNLTLSKTSYAQGETIVISFANGPGNPKDWIGVYPKGTGPQPGSTIWGYVGGGGHTATAGLTDGTIMLGAGSENNPGDWPLAAGTWVAYFLVNDGYQAIASIQIEVKP